MTETVEYFGRIDVLVNAVGQAVLKPLLEMVGRSSS